MKQSNAETKRKEHKMINCYNSEYKGNSLICAVTGEICNPRICQGCDRLNTVNYYTAYKEISELIDFCEKNCEKYYQCGHITELNDKLKKYEEK